MVYKLIAYAHMDLQTLPWTRTPKLNFWITQNLMDIFVDSVSTAEPLTRDQEWVYSRGAVVSWTFCIASENAAKQSARATMSRNLVRIYHDSMENTQNLMDIFVDSVSTAEPLTRDQEWVYSRGAVVNRFRKCSQAKRSCDDVTQPGPHIPRQHGECFVMLVHILFDQLGPHSFIPR
jgi:hypothetical protein